MKLSDSLTLPPEALKHHWAILGITGAGKSYTVRAYVEKLLDAGQRVCIIDPKGDWWGLKSSSDGKSPGYPVVIFGGDHADLPIDPSSGAVLGELVATGNRPCIIDLMHFSEAGKSKFMEDFLGELHRKNRSRITVVLEEAHEFAPQASLPEARRMLHATNRLLSQGRSKGVQVILSSQRPAKVHKDALTQAQVLVAMRVISVQDRDAIEAWVGGVGDKKAAQQVMDSLAKMPTGEGWVYAPMCDILQRVKFPRIKTFDSGATPDDSECVDPTGWSEVNLDEIKSRFEAVQTAVAETNPKKLQAEVKRLKAELQKALGTPVQVAPQETEQLRAQLAAERECRAKLEVVCHRLDEVIAQTRLDIGLAMTAPIRESAARRETSEPRSPNVPMCGTLVHSDCARSSEPPSNGRLSKPPKAAAKVEFVHRAGIYHGNPSAIGLIRQVSGLTGPQQRLVDSLAWWAAIDDHEPSRTQVGFIAEYTATSGTFRTLLSECRKLGLIEYVGASGVTLTPTGTAAAAVPTIPSTLGALHDRVLGKLTGPQKKLFLVLVDRHRGGEVTRTQAAELAGYEATSGTFRTLLSEMKGLGLITYPKKTTVQASRLLFPPQLATRTSQ